MIELFLFTLLLGVIYIAFCLISGRLFNFTRTDHDHDIGIDWSHIGIFDIPISPIKPLVIASFMIVFGWGGLVGLRYYELPSVLSLLVAFTLALIISFISFRFIVVPLYRKQNGLVHDYDELKGKTALITSLIDGENYGRARYKIQEGTFSTPAKSSDGQIIEEGERVLITGVDKNILYVERLPEDTGE